MLAVLQQSCKKACPRSTKKGEMAITHSCDASVRACAPSGRIAPPAVTDAGRILSVPPPGWKPLAVGTPRLRGRSAWTCDFLGLPGRCRVNAAFQSRSYRQDASADALSCEICLCCGY